MAKRSKLSVVAGEGEVTGVPSGNSGTVKDRSRKTAGTARTGNKPRKRKMKRSSSKDSNWSDRYKKKTAKWDRENEDHYDREEMKYRARKKAGKLKWYEKVGDALGISNHTLSERGKKAWLTKSQQKKAKKGGK